MASAERSMTQEMQAGWRKIVARAWSDDEFKRQLMEDPRSVLADAGLPVSTDVSYVVVENDARCVHLILPARPGGDVSIRHLTDGDYDPGF
jgi:Nitrile hydratase, alpha chain